MSGMSRSPLSPQRMSPQGGLSPVRPAAAAPLDMTAPADRYKLRACLTCLAQVRTLLLDVQANPEPLAVPEDYVPLSSLGEGDETAPPDILTTPRPLRRDRLAASRRDSHLADQSGLYSLDDELDTQAGLAELEDGRVTALQAVAARAQHDPRLATVQGLLQHIEQLTLEGDDTEHLITSYPSWLAPQMSQVLGTINSMYPTAARRAADRLAAARARAFRDAVGVAEKEERLVSTGQFESFLERHLQDARKRQERLAQLSELQSGNRDAKAAANGSAGAGDDDDEAGANTTIAATAGRKTAAAADDDDPFASMGGGAGANADADADADASSEHNERKRQDRLAADLREMTPRSRKAHLHTLAQRGSTRESTLRDTSRRPNHAKPFGYASHKHKRIGDPLGPPPPPCNKYEKAPRSARAPSLYEPRKTYAVSTTHPPKQKNTELTGSGGGGGTPSAKKKTRRMPQHHGEEEHGEGADHEDAHHREEAPGAEEEEEEDPFAAHDPEAPAASNSRARSHAPSVRASAKQLSQAWPDQEEKEQQHEEEQPADRHRRSAALSLADVDGDREREEGGAEASDDDPFAAHDSAASLARSPPPPPAKRAQPRSSASPALVRRSGAPPMPQSPVAAIAARPSPARSATPSRSASRSSTSASLLRTATRSRPVSPAASSARVSSYPPTQKRPTTAAARRPRAMGDDNPFSSRAALHPPATAAVPAPAPAPAPFARSGIGASHRGLFDEEPSSWQDVELKLLAMNEELREQRDRSHRDVQQEVSEAMQKLSHSLAMGLDPLSHASKASLHPGGGAEEHGDGDGDMPTQVWEDALHRAFAQGKRVVQEHAQEHDHEHGDEDDFAATTVFVPSGTASAARLAASPQRQHSQSQSQRQSYPVDEAHVTALLGATLATAQSELQSSQSAAAKLAEEKAELQRALAELQARDAAHAQSLFQLMDKLNSMGAGGGHAAALTPSQQDRAAQQRLRQSQRAQLATAAFVAPFGSPLGCGPMSPVAAAAAAARRLHPLGSPLAHGDRSLRVASPEEIEAEACLAEGFVEGLDAPGPAPPHQQAYYHPPLSDEQQEQQAQEARLHELSQELAQAQHQNETLRLRLAESSMESAVLSRTAQEQRVFLAQSLATQGDVERERERARIQAHEQQRQDDLRKVQQSEKQMLQIVEEQRSLRAKFDADRAALESNTRKLLEELAQKTEEQKRMQAEANLMRGRLEQLQQEQAAGMGSYGGSGGMGGPHSRRAAPSQPRGAGAAARGGADGSGHADPDSSAAAAALLGPDGHPLPPVPPSFLAFLTSSFRGDYLKLRHSAAVAHTLANHAQMDRAQGRGAQQGRQGQPVVEEEEEEIVFSDYVTKYNRRNAGQARVLVLTGQALYLFAGPSVQNLDLRRRVALRDLTKLSLSRLCTDLVVLHHATDHDILLTSPKRPELMYNLQQCWSALSGGRSSLPYELGERLYVKDRRGMVRDVQILDSQRFKLGKAFPMQGLV